MKIGLFSVLYQSLSLEEALDKMKEKGIEAVELGTGAYPGSHHCNPDELSGSAARRKQLLDAVRSRGMLISALSVHGNPLHPDEAFAAGSHEAWRKTVKLARQLEVEVINVLSGCPGAPSGGKHPNWVTCSWPPDYEEILKWQWKEKVIPYWRKEAAHARKAGVKIAIEMHPGFVVYNPDTLLRLREACGPEIGCNFDPSHLCWQGMDPVQAVFDLGQAGAIFHMHAKDVFVDQRNVRRKGVLDTAHYGDVANRSWTFRSLGYGQGLKVWSDMVSALRTVGYDFVLSIEHEDPLASTEEGLNKAVQFLKQIIFSEPPGEMFWA